MAAESIPPAGPDDLRQDWASVSDRHPAGAVLRRFFPLEGPQPTIIPAPPDFPSSLDRKDYLPVIAGIVDFFRQYQSPEGAILDPYQKAERQYSTPAFAVAGAILVREADRQDLLDPVLRALTFAIHALANRTTADGHADFYIPMVIHARRLLKPAAPAEVVAGWDRDLLSLDPETAYRDRNAGNNWNLVNVSGECLRRQDGLVAPEMRDQQAAYVDRCLEKQKAHFTPAGMYEDPNAPLAYDAFPRLWLEDVLANDAYSGAHRQALLESLTRGALSTLLLLSPSGEWACGGRSAHHQWNEAEVAVIAEVNARRWQQRGRPDVAGAFKRAARLALTSIRRWRRPSGELWIVKNHADPALRHGYEGYSFHSQYNLLPAAMLALAYLHADDEIPEHPRPTETGGFVFPVLQPFHKVVAAAGGAYILLDTGCDPHYNATGLLRFHHASVPLSPLSDSTALERAYGPKDPAAAAAAITPGIQWQADGGDWLSLAHFSRPGRENPPGARIVQAAQLEVLEESPGSVRFRVHYTLAGPGARPVTEEYRVSREGVELASQVGGDPTRTRVVFPALVSDGANPTALSLKENRAEIVYAGCSLVVAIESAVKLALDPEHIPVHNGWAQPLVAELPGDTMQVQFRLKLSLTPARIKL